MHPPISTHRYMYASETFSVKILHFHLSPPSAQLPRVRCVKGADGSDGESEILIIFLGKFFRRRYLDTAISNRLSFLILPFLGLLRL